MSASQLVESLRLDLRLVRTYLRSAELSAANDRPHAEEALRTAQVALRSVRYAISRIEDPRSKAEITSQAEELARDIQRVEALCS